MEENIRMLLLNLAHQSELAKEVTTEGPTPGVPTAAALPVDVAAPKKDDSSSNQVKEVVYTTTKTGKILKKNINLLFIKPQVSQAAEQSPLKMIANTLKKGRFGK